MKASGKQVFLSFRSYYPLYGYNHKSQNVRGIGQFFIKVGGIGCLVPCSGPNLALFESCGAMDGESCAILHRGNRAKRNFSDRARSL